MFCMGFKFPLSVRTFSSHTVKLPSTRYAEISHFLLQVYPTKAYLRTSPSKMSSLFSKKVEIQADLFFP